MARHSRSSSVLEAIIVLLLAVLAGAGAVGVLPVPLRELLIKSAHSVLMGMTAGG